MSHPSQPSAVLSGTVVAQRYKVSQLLGSGGTSEVWLATDERLGRPVALKILRSEWNGERMGARVEQEARAAAQLRHPAVVQIYDVGRIDASTPFVVMEYLEGRTLRQMIDQQDRLSPEDAVAALLPILDGLAAAHERGIVHRDVKPDNIFLSRLHRSRLQPKLVDFGVARLAQYQQKLTMVGTLVGTPAYMAPEQVLGEPNITPAADIWALGVTLYEAAVGQMPFEGESLQDLFGAIMVSPVPYPRHVADFDGDLFGFIADMLRKNASERPSAVDLMAPLSSWLQDRGVETDLSGLAVAEYLAAPPASSVATMSPPAPDQGPPLPLSTLAT